MDFTAVVTMDSEDLAVELAMQLSHEEILEFIVTLDSIICDWSFTEALYKWARGEHKVYKAETKEF